MRRFRRRDEQAQRRLDDLTQRQDKVAAAMTQIRRENGFIRMIRESMGPAR